MVIADRLKYRVLSAVTPKNEFVHCLKPDFENTVKAYNLFVEELARQNELVKKELCTEESSSGSYFETGAEELKDHFDF